MSKIKLDRELFLQAIKKAVDFVPKKTVIPAHDYFLIVAKKGEGITIHAANSESQVTVNAIAKVEADVAFCIPARILVKTVDLFREPEVVFNCAKIDKSVVEIKSGKSKYKLGTLSHGDFPLMPAPVATNEISIMASEFRSALDTCKEFADSTGPLSALSGISVRELDNKIHVTAADRAIMCSKIIKPRSINKWEPIIIPVAASKLIKNAYGDSDVLDIFHDDKKMLIQCSTADILVMLVDQKFPNTEQIFNFDGQEFKINTRETLDALKRLALYDPEAAPYTTMETIAGTNEILMYTSNDSMNFSGEEYIIQDVMNDEKVDFKITLNTEKFMTLLEAIDENEIVVKYVSHTRGILVTPVIQAELDINKKLFITPLFLQDRTNKDNEIV